MKLPHYGTATVDGVKHAVMQGTTTTSCGLSADAMVDYEPRKNFAKAGGTRCPECVANASWA